MKQKCSIRLAVVMSVAALAWPALAAESNDTVQWQTLFNGKDLTGWQVVNGGEFSVTNGWVHLEKGSGWLRTEREFTNFVFEAEWRGLETNYNSGFFIRAGLAGKPFPDGGWQVNTKQTAIGQLIHGKDSVVQSKTPAKPAGDWCKFRVEARGKMLTLFVDDAEVWKQELDVEHGYLGLQAEGRKMDFRNLRVKEIP